MDTSIMYQSLIRGQTKECELLPAVPLGGINPLLGDRRKDIGDKSGEPGVHRINPLLGDRRKPVEVKGDDDTTESINPLLGDRRKLIVGAAVPSSKTSYQSLIRGQTKEKASCNYCHYHGRCGINPLLGDRRKTTMKHTTAPITTSYQSLIRGQTKVQT